jgi:8-oxo-dGTP diphosphatase
LLLVRRAIEPWFACWDIPGGFCEAQEHPEAAVVREVREEVGLTVEVHGLAGIWMDTYGPPGPYEQTTLNCYYHAVVLGDQTLRIDLEESSAARWFGPDEIPAELAFPAHSGQVIAAWRAWVAGGASSG